MQKTSFWNDKPNENEYFFVLIMLTFIKIDFFSRKNIIFLNADYKTKMSGVS